MANMYRLFLAILFFFHSIPSISGFIYFGREASIIRKGKIQQFLSNHGIEHIPDPPGPLKKASIKLVNDAAHPFRRPSPNDMRGPCPGLNTLANHGYLPRNGVATPGQIITAVMEGYNLGNDFAKFLVYQTHLMDGNPLTNMLSIGPKSKMTGTDPPDPALVGGLSQHGTFEGDTSMTRVDAYFGDPTQFDPKSFEVFEAVAKQFGANGTYDINAAAELRHQRFQNSVENNPQLVFTSPRILSAYSEAIFAMIFFVDGRKNNRQLTIDAARSFFKNARMPADFHRQPAPVSFSTVQPLVKQIHDAYPFTPGVNHGKNNFVEMPETPTLFDFCGIYEDIVLRVIKGQYPQPTGHLKYALEKNLDFFFSSVQGQNCTQVFPW